MSRNYLSWLDIFRLGLVQSALGSVVVLTTSTLNRIMVVELALAAMIPGFLVALHYAVQMSRPRWGFGSDEGGRRTPWIIGGMAILVVGAFLAAGTRRLLASHWEVYDRWSADFMQRFSERLAGQLEAGQSCDYALALHRAREEVRERCGDKPAVWAPFVLVGSPTDGNKPVRTNRSP